MESPNIEAAQTKIQTGYYDRPDILSASVEAMIERELVLVAVTAKTLDFVEARMKQIKDQRDASQEIT